MKIFSVFKFIIFATSIVMISTSVHADKGEKSMLLDKPYFTIYLEATDCHGEIALNKQRITFENGSPANVEYPINQWIKSGENLLSMYLVYGKDKKFIVNANCKVTLRVRQSGSDPSSNITIATLLYSAVQAKSGTGIEGNTSAATLNSHENFKQDSNGDVNVGIVNNVVDDNSALIVSRKIVLPKIGLPKWAYFSSDNLTGLNVPDIWGKMSDETHDSIVKEILPIYHKIWSALKNKDVDSIMPYYSERNRELDIAFNNETGTLSKQLTIAFKNAVSDPDRKLQPIDETNITAHVFDNDKLVNLQHNNNSPVIYFKYSDGMVEYYDIILRKQGDRWVITR